MRPQNSFIDERYMNPAGEPLPFTNTFVPGLVVKNITQEEWDEAAIEHTNSSRAVARSADGTTAQYCNADCGCSPMDCTCG